MESPTKKAVRQRIPRMVTIKAAAQAVQHDGASYPRVVEVLMPTSPLHQAQNKRYTPHSVRSAEGTRQSDADSQCLEPNAPCPNVCHKTEETVIAVHRRETDLRSSHPTELFAYTYMFQICEAPFHPHAALLRFYFLFLRSLPFVLALLSPQGNNWA